MTHLTSSSFISLVFIDFIIYLGHLLENIDQSHLLYNIFLSKCNQILNPSNKFTYLLQIFIFILKNFWVFKLLIQIFYIFCGQSITIARIFQYWYAYNLLSIMNKLSIIDSIICATFYELPTYNLIFKNMNWIFFNSKKWFSLSYNNYLILL